MSNAKDMTQAEFQKAMKEGGTYLIDFWAEWCPPCKTMGPIIDELSKDEELKEINFAKVDVDKEGPLSGQFGVRSIPTFVLLKFKGDGTFDMEKDIIKKFVGSQPAFDFKIKLQEALNSL